MGNVSVCINGYNETENEMFVTFDPSWRCRHHQSVCQQQHESRAALRPAGGPEGTRVRRQVDSDPSPAAELEPEHVLPRTLLDAP